MFWGIWGLFFTILFFNSKGFSAPCETPPSDHVQSLVRSNTFKIVPRNTYASSMSVAQARQLHAQHCASAELTISERLNCSNLKSCQGEQCKIEFMPFGTAFFTAEGDKLLTAWHVVYPSHAAALLFLQNNLTNLTMDELNQTLSVLAPDFILLDQNDQLIFDTKTAYPKSTYSFWGNPLSPIYQNQGFNKNQAYGFFENAPDDFVAIQLQLPQTDLPTGLRFRPTTKASLEGSCLHAAGFQYHNGQFSLSSGKLTAVKELQAKLSFMIPFQLEPLPMGPEEILKKSVSEILLLMGYGENLIQEMLKKHTNEKLLTAIKVVLQTQSRNMRDQALADHDDVIFFDAPALPGQSGGPIVDDHGNVVGLTTNSFYDKQVINDHHYAAYGSAGVLIKALRF